MTSGAETGKLRPPMSRHDFEKSVRMFRKFSEETLRRRGGGPMSREGVVALQAIEATLRGEQRLDGELLEPLAAFTNLLQSGQLPPEFGHFSLGDALLAVEEAQALAGEAAAQLWEFAPELSGQVASQLAELKVGLGPSDHGAENDGGGARAHAEQSRNFILEAAARATPGAAVVVGASQAPYLPLAELAARFQRLTLNALSTRELEEAVRATVPEALRERVQIERYDLTGSYDQFFREGAARVEAAGDLAEAERSLLELVASYDVGAGSAGLCSVEARADFAVSCMVLPTLGAGFELHAADCLTKRGWPGAQVREHPLAPALALFVCLIQQHHIHALLRRAQLGVLISGVAETPLRTLPNGKIEATGDTLELLAVERLRERLPSSAEILAEASWEWSAAAGAAPGATRTSLMVEGIALRKAV